MEQSNTTNETLLEAPFFNPNFSKAIFENVFDGIGILNSKFETIYRSPNVVRSLGYAAGERLGKTPVELVHPDDLTKVIDAFSEMLKTPGSSATEDVRIMHKNGSWVHIEAYATNMLDNPSVKGIVVNYRDITARKKAEKESAETERKYTHLTSIMPVGMFKSDIEGKCVYVNKKWIEMTGLSLKESLGDKWIKAIHPDDKERVLKEWSRATTRLRSSNNEFRFKHVNGKITWVYGQASTDCDSDGKCIGYVGTITDITEQKHAELALLKNEQRSIALLNAIPDMILRISKQGLFLDCKIASTFTPYVKPEDFLGKHVTAILPPKVATTCEKYIKKTLKTGKVQTYDYSLPNEDGSSSYFEARLITSGNDEVIALVRDITQRKIGELALMNSKEELKESNHKLHQVNQRLETIREEEKKKIAMEIHDELGQELTATKLGLYWLQQYLSTNRDKIDLSALENKIESLIDLSSNTISSVRKIAHQLRPATLDNLGLVSAIKWQIQTMQENSKINLRFKSKLVDTNLNLDFSTALFRIVQESVTNIIRHSKATNAEINLYTSCNSLILFIQDDGIGISEKDLHKHGAIGIFSIKERVNNWGGVLTLKSENLQGTTLKIIFPEGANVKKA